MSKSFSLQSSQPLSRPAAAAVLSGVIVIWGANWPVMKICLKYMPPLDFAAARMLMGAVLLAGVALVTGKLRLPSRHDWKLVFSVGLMQMGGFLTLIVLGLQFVPAGRSSILAYTTPLWVVPGAALILGERIDRLKLAGFLLGISGVVVMFNPAGFDWSDPHVLLGNGLLLCGALLWAGQIMQVRGHRWDGSPLSLAPWQFAVAACLLVPLAAILEHGRSIHWTPALGAILLYNGPLATAFGFWAMLSVTRALPAVTTSLSTLGVPVVGVVSGALALGEPVTPTNIGGLALIGGGLVLVTLSDRHSRRPAGASMKDKQDAVRDDTVEETRS